MNLYEETTKDLENHGQTWEDVLWVGGNDFEIPLKDFIRLAKEIDYDNGYGAQFVAADLMIITTDGRFVREEYDGLEWWKFIPAVVASVYRSNINSLVSKHGWETLKEINEEEEIYAYS